MKPNPVGPKDFFLNHGISSLTTANLAAIDVANAQADLYPYAYTATVAEAYDGRNFAFDDAGSTLVAGQGSAVGLFLTPDNDKGNLLFQVSGRSDLVCTSTGYAGIVSGFFFGRRATSDTVVSSVAAAANQLASFTKLALDTDVYLPFSTASQTFVKQSICNDVFSLELSTGYVYCFGFYFKNHSGSDLILRGSVSLSMRKYSTEVSPYNPRG